MFIDIMNDLHDMKKNDDDDSDYVEDEESIDSEDENNFNFVITIPKKKRDSYDDDDDDYNYKYKKPKTNHKNKYLKIFDKEISKLTEISSDTLVKRYFKNAKEEEKNDIIKKIEEINKNNDFNKPLFNRLLLLDVNINEKTQIINKYFNSLEECNSHKIKEWINNVVKIPFKKYSEFNLKTIKKNDINKFFDDLNDKMTKAILGHDAAKNHILQIMAQQITNPKAKGTVIGIYGPPGNGKSTLIKDGIAKAMNKPFYLIALGGARDGSYLDGHLFTWEGSIYGRIVEALIHSKCMDPIIYFDELDKISESACGIEIENVLIHLTDPVQNGQFRDKYFDGIDFDLSKVTFIFSYNDPSKINKILLDRITQIKTSGLLLNQKINIIQNYSIPEILKDIGLKSDMVSISDNIIEYIILTYTREGGVRGIKKLIYQIIRELNMLQLTDKIKLPVKITKKLIKQILKNKNKIVHEKINEIDQVGVINGLYYSDDGGGITPIELSWYPSERQFDIIKTGNLQNTIKESIDVAKTVAFNYLNLELQKQYISEWKTIPKGLHIHIGDGSTPKDGPSAGTAITVGIYSLLTDSKIRKDVAITGEINLCGKVNSIGGLDSKLQGAKNAGVKLVLYPYDNKKDIDLIIELNPTLIDDNFQIKTIKTIEEAIKYSIVNE
jgi:endopeptidase La